MLSLIKKQIVVIAISGLFSYQLQAAYSVLSNIQDQLTALEEKVALLEQTTSYGKQGARLAGGLPNIKDPKGLIVEFDLLYFKTQLGGTAFAYSNNYAAGSIPIKAQLQEINFSMDWGLRISAEKLIVQEDWSIGAYYTHFRTSGSQSRNSRINDSQMPLKGLNFNGNEGVGFIKSIGNVQWNDLELDLKKSYFVNKSFLLEPMIGLKSSWLDLKQWSQYNGGYISVNTDHVKDRSKYFGLGPSIGNKAEWFLGNGFSLSGLVDIGLEYGIFKVSYDENLSNDKTKKIHLTESKHQFSPVFDFAFDINYGFYFKQNKSFINFSLGYEAIFFLKQNQMLQLIGNNGYRIQNISEDLSFHGITGGISVTL